jgi:hypothetical protein
MTSIRLAQIKNMVTNALLGRYTSGSGEPEVILIGDGLILTGNTLSATSTGSSSGEVIMVDGITPPDPVLTEDETDWVYEG